VNTGQTVFAQIMDYLPSYEFQKCVARYRGDAHGRGFSCLDQYLAMAFAQLTYRESLRDIEACLRSMSGKLYHFRGRVARTTLGAFLAEGDFTPAFHPSSFRVGRKPGVIRPAEPARCPARPLPCNQCRPSVFRRRIGSARQLRLDTVSSP
jgi:hypothetical protein